MIDPPDSEAVCAKAEIVEFARWLVNAKHTRISAVVRRLEVLMRASYERGLNDAGKCEPDTENG